MSAADRIGLLGYSAWLTGHGYWVTLLLCLLLTPGMMIVIALVLESRILPLHPRHQFLAFFPGDILLGAMTAGLLVLAQRLPDESRWYNSMPFHGVMQGVSLLVAVVLTVDELKRGEYSSAAVMSPTKIYHNILLYGGYGYVIVTTLIAVLFGSTWSMPAVVGLLCSLASGLVWLTIMVLENKLPAHELREKANGAHVEDWAFAWSERGRGRLVALINE